jgi:hypothetical protein
LSELKKESYNRFLAVLFADTQYYQQEIGVITRLVRVIQDLIKLDAPNKSWHDKGVLDSQVQNGKLHLHILTIFLFENELAKIISKIEDPMISLIKLKWWEDEIDKIYDNEEYAKHHILESLAEIIQNYQIKREIFAKIFATLAKLPHGELFIVSELLEQIMPVKNFASVQKNMAIINNYKKDNKLWLVMRLWVMSL